MSVMNLAQHLDGRQHKNKISAMPAETDGIRFICRLGSNSPSGGGQWLSSHVDSPVHRHNLVEELMRFGGRRGRFLYAPEKIERQLELAKERISAHLRLLHWVLDDNKLDEYYHNCLE